MRRDEALRNLSKHRRETKGFGVKRIAVFGSVVRNEAGPESGIDVPRGFDLEARVRLFEFVVEVEVGWMTNLPR